MEQRRDLFGRKKIFTTQRSITKDNVISVLNSALQIHMDNHRDIDYLYWYRRGDQPILERTKTVRPEINNKVVENHPDEICSFKNGMFLTQPAFYVSLNKDSAETEKVNQLNKYIRLSGKQQSDNEVTDWFHTCGVGILYLMPQDNNEIPIAVYTLDPRCAFCIYSCDIGNECIAGVHCVLTGENEARFDVYTKDYVYYISGGCIGENSSPSYVPTQGMVIEEIKPNMVKDIPMFEYFYDNNRMGAFEKVIPLLDSLNTLMSNRLDGIEQYIQAFIKFVNCDIDEESFKALKDLGAIKVKSVDGNQAEVDIVCNELDQTQTQVLVDYIYQQVLTICGMPSTTKGGTSTSDTGAAVLYRDGWYQADVCARNTSDLFKKSNRQFDKLFLKILKDKNILDINISDIELQFTRNETSNLLVKTQGALNLKQLGYSPELAFAKSGISNDPVGDVVKSEKYIDRMWNVNKQNIEEPPDNKNLNSEGGGTVA